MAGGRDQLGPLERVTRILRALDAERMGIPSSKLAAIGGYKGTAEDQNTQLQREIRHLNDRGWDIRNVAASGEAARYRMYARDNRLRVRLDPLQQAELVRAAHMAGDVDFADGIGLDLDPAHLEVRTQLRTPTTDDALDRVIYATKAHCLLYFTYKQRPRVVHPVVVYSGASGWYVEGREDGSDTVKRFVTDRMSDVTIGRPGTAETPQPHHRERLDPVSWTVDPPTDVVVETQADYRGQVERALGTPHRVEPTDGTVRLTIPVTHRAAFRARLYHLGTRVRVLAPDEFRAEILAELTAIAEAD